MSLSGIDYLIQVMQQKAAQADADAKAAAERQRALTKRPSTPTVGVAPTRTVSLSPTTLSVSQSLTAQRLAVKLKAFNTSLSPDEAALFETYLERAARSS